MEKISLTTTYKQKLFEAIVRYRVMKDKSPEQRRHLINMELEYQHLITQLLEKKVTQLRIPKSERVYDIVEWNPILTFKTTPECTS